MEHSRLSASGSHIWLNCPGSIKQCEGLPEKASHFVTIEGSGAHKLWEIYFGHFLRGEQFDIWEFLGTEIEGALIDREMIFSLENMKEWVMSILKDGDKISIENRVNLAYLHPDLWGTSDVIIEHSDGTITVIDLKYGYWSVDPKENSQLIFYFLGARAERNIPYGDIIIYQPRDRKGNIIKRWRFEKKDFEKWENLFREKARLADIGTPLVKGEWCKFCPAFEQKTCSLHKLREQRSQF